MAENLQKKIKSYEEKPLGHLFAINNYYYIDQ